MSADLYVFDEDGLFMNSDKDDFFLFEFDNSSNIIQIENPTQNLNNSNKVIVILDQSGSMLNSSNDIAKLAIEELVKGLGEDFSEISLVAFNTRNYLMSDFTNDKEAILNQLKFTDPRNSSSLNAAFLNSPNGALQIAESNPNSHIVFISDGVSSGNFNEIQTRLQNSNTSLHSLFINQSAPSFIKNISNNVYENLNNNNIENFAFIIRKKIAANKASIIRWVSEDCRINKKINLISKNGFGDIFSSYSIGENQKPFIEIENGVTDFGIVNQGNSVTKDISIIPRNGNFEFEEILINCSEFTFDENLPDILLQDTEYKIQVTFSPMNENFKVCVLQLLSSSCEETFIYVQGGDPNGALDTKNLNVINPQLNDEFYPGELIEINWTGILPNDSVKIEFRTNELESWNIINPKVSQVPYYSIVPNSITNDAQIKVTQLSNNNRFSNVNYISPEETIIDLSWDYLSTDLALSLREVNDDKVVLWDPFSESIIGNIGNGLQDLTVIKSANITPRTAVFKKEDGGDKDLILLSNGDDDIIELIGASSDIIDVAWHPQDTAIAAILDNGDLYIWNDPEGSNNQVDKIFKNIMDNEATKITWSEKYNLIAIGDVLGNLKVIDANDGSVVVSRLINAEINNLKWNKDGDSLFVSGKDVGFFVYRYFIDQGVFKNIETHREFISDLEYADLHVSRSKVFFTEDNRIMVYDLSSREIEYTYLVHEHKVVSIACSNDFTASLDESNVIQVWSEEDAPHESNSIQSAVSEKFKIIEYDFRIKNINFGDQCIGFAKDSLFFSTFSNSGDKDLTIDSIVILNNELNELTLGIEIPFEIEANSFSFLTASIIPQTEGFKEFTILTYTNGYEFESSIWVNVINPDVGVVNELIDFGSINIGSSTFIDFVSLINNNSFNVEIVDTEVLYGEVPFSLLSEATLVLPENSELTSRVSFSPKRKGKFNALLKYYADVNCTPLELILIGEASVPEFTTENIYSFDLDYCENEKEFEIEISNTGNGPLEIWNLNSNNPQILVDNSSTISIDPASKSSIKFVSEQELSTTVSSVISFNHSLIESLNTGSSFTVISSLDSKEILLSSEEILFTEIPVNTPSSKTFSIDNKSNEELTLELTDYEFFRILSISPNPIPSKSSSTVVVEFKGGESGEEYRQSHTFNDLCENTLNVDLIALPGIGEANLTAYNLISFPDLNCENTITDTTISLINSGGKTLEINSFVLNDPNFIISENNSIEIEPGESYKLNISFQASEYGNYNAELVLNTNINDNNGEFIINLIGKRNISLIDIDNELIVFEDIPENETDQKSIIITNNGNIPLLIPDNFDTGKFELIELSKSIIQTSESSTLTFLFEGGESDEVFSEVYSFNDDCDNNYEIRLQANVRSSRFAVLSTETKEAEVGDIIPISIFFENPKEIELPEEFTLSTTISFNSTVLVPQNLENTFIDGKRRYVPFEIQMNNNQIGMVKSIDALVTLGNSIDTDISFTGSLILEDREIWFKENSGILSVSNVCYEGDGVRLIHGENELTISNVYPNPSDKEISIDLHSIEDGDIEVIIYNSNSREVIRKEFTANQDQQILNLDVSKLGNGSYYMIIKTRSQTFERKFVVVH